MSHYVLIFMFWVVNPNESFPRIHEERFRLWPIECSVKPKQEQMKIMKHTCEEILDSYRNIVIGIGKNVQFRGWCKEE